MHFFKSIALFLFFTTALFSPPVFSEKEKIGPKNPTSSEYCGSLFLGVQRALSESRRGSVANNLRVHDRESILRSLDTFVAQHLTGLTSNRRYISPQIASHESPQSKKIRVLSRVISTQKDLHSNEPLDDQFYQFYALALRGQEAILDFWAAQNDLLEDIQQGTSVFLQKHATGNRHHLVASSSLYALSAMNGAYYFISGDPSYAPYFMLPVFVSSLFQYTPAQMNLTPRVAIQRWVNAEKKKREILIETLDSANTERWAYSNHFNYLPQSLLAPMLTKQQFSIASQELAAIMLDQDSNSDPVAIDVDQILTFENGTTSNPPKPILFIFLRIHKSQPLNLRERQSESRENSIFPQPAHKGY